jgi:molybdopterin molybdotransferase
LAAAIAEGGGEPLPFGIVRDRPEAIRSALQQALEADMVLTSGGVSVGKFDFVREVHRALGVREKFWGVAQKPGKPLSFGICGRTPVFGLPGNPVSALVCFYVYVLPALRKLAGAERLFLPGADAVAAEDIFKARDLVEFVRCRLEGEPGRYRVRPTGTQSSGVLRSMSLGEALAVGPAGAGVLPAGSRVRVVLLQADGASATPPF